MTYQLNLPPQWKIHNTFHGTLLNPYIETAEHGPNFAEPPPDLVEGEPEYEVENILKSRRKGRGRKLEYLVKWKGYVLHSADCPLTFSLIFPTLPLIFRAFPLYHYPRTVP